MGKKRFVSILLSVCMVLALMPQMVFADDTAELQGLINSAYHLYGKVTLDKDYNISSSLTVNKTFTLDLNGHVIRMTGSGSVIKIFSDVELTLTDSESTAVHEGENASLPAGGVITGGNAKYGGGVDVQNGKLIMNGGTIYICTAQNGGGGVAVKENATFTMNGGAIRDCSASFGGGVYSLNPSTFTMAGGMIEDCTATSSGGSVDNRGTMNADGGEVKGNVQNNATITKASGDGTKFYGEVKNNGTISGGVYYGGIAGKAGYENGIVTANYRFVDFNLNGGSGSVPVRQWFIGTNAPALKPTTKPTREGYTFEGWYRSNSDSEYDFNQVVTTVVYLKARWKDIQNPVITGLEDGKTYCSEQTVTVTDNDSIQSVTVNDSDIILVNKKFTLYPAVGAQEIIATDKAGNRMTVTVTVNDGHTYGDWTSNGNNTHRRNCTINGCSGYEDGNCEGGTATCISKAICDTCKVNYGEFDSTNHDLENIAGKAPTYSEAGYKQHWQCKDCKKYFSDAAGTNEIADIAAWKTGEGKINKLTLPSKTDSVTSGKDGSVSVSLDKSVSTLGGKTTAKVTDSVANTILAKLASSESKNVVIDATAGSGTSTQVVISELAVKKLAEVKGIEITLVTDNGKVVLDKDTLTAVASKAGNDGQVAFIIETVERSGSILKVELKIQTSGGDVTGFDGGRVAVTVGIDDELRSRNPVCVYIDEQNLYSKIGGMLNDDGTFTFVTGHFSTYAIMPEADADAVIKEQTAAAQKAAIKNVKTTVTLSTKELKKGIRVAVKVPEDQKADKTGIIIYRSTSKNAKPYAVYKKVATKGSTYIIRNYYDVKGNRLVKGKTYYYKARAYKVIDGKTYYSPMSTIKAIKAK